MYRLIKTDKTNYLKEEKKKLIVQKRYQKIFTIFAPRPKQYFIKY